MRLYSRNTPIALLAILSDGSAMPFVGHMADGFATLVGASGSALSARTIRAILSGEIMVTTSHQVGIFATRAEGGLVPSLPDGARKWLFAKRLTADSRWTPAYGRKFHRVLKATYNQQ